MKISKIEVQKRNKKRSSVYIDGEFKFGLDNEIILKYGLEEGSEIGEDQIKNILLAEEKQKIKQRAYRLLRYRGRSIAEMNERLQRLGYEPEIVREVVNELVGEGILDDQKFVRDFVSDYTNLKPKGNYFILSELKKKGIAEEKIKEVINSRDEKRLINELLRTKFKDLNVKNPKDKAKIIRRLISRGFTPGVVYEVLAE
ncbi:MAG: RecX family transcriptional regulator [candidate division WOR-3 bacterium]